MNRFETELKTKLQNHSAEVPADMWTNISAELVEESPNRYIFFYWMTGLLIIALLGLIAFKSIAPSEMVAVQDVEVIADEPILDENSTLIPLESELNRDGNINNLIITKSSLKNSKEIDVSNSEFIDNLKAIRKAHEKK